MHIHYLAHAELRSSNPSEGAVLKALPATMKLTFTEAPSKDKSVVTLGGTRLHLSSSPSDAKTLVADLSKVPHNVRGPVVVAWRSVSADDGHVADGVIHLTVASGPASPRTEQAAQVPEPDSGSGDVIWYAGLAAAFVILLAIGISVALRRPGKGTRGAGR
ncbi:copper resistance protein CopC [Actinomadura barringtoniae]|uniref:Copper resistance protein CopC n=1 Tax=Actinomadura barringtoniae TaxID=1427535 RepID=A0A939PQP1_9ACTN|nr:copper resistance CopC family protein [Actinomadura barringtoniae]MBO2452971.1 copper resistance protein CopC [Actinomadura barringtoniae]